MLTHGYGKFLKVLNGNFKFGDPIGLGPELSLILVVAAEFFGSIALILGLGTRISAFMLAFTMAVAGFIRHADDPFGQKEKVFLFLAGFIVMLIAGGGKYSVDSKLD